MQQPSSTQAKPDRLASTMAWILGIGFVLLALLVLDAVGAFRPARAQSELTRTALTDACPTPQPGEKLILTIESRDGALQVRCDTVRPFGLVRKSRP